MRQLVIAFFIVMNLNCFADNTAESAAAKEAGSNNAKKQLIAAFAEIARVRKLEFESFEKGLKRGTVGRAVYFDALLALYHADAQLACVKGDKNALVAELTKTMEYHQKQRENATRRFDKGLLSRTDYRAALMRDLRAKARLAQAKVYGCAPMFSYISN